MPASPSPSSAGLRLLPRINALVDGFIPAGLAADHDRRQQARMFLISHIFGPFIGNSVPLAIFSVHPTPDMQLVVLAISITGFWVFPFLLRAGYSYNALALSSIQNLIFCIMWSVYFYGGATSPTLPWVLTIPLLAFLYLNATPKLWVHVLGLFGANCAAFWAAWRWGVGAVHYDLPFDKLQIFGLVSTFAAAGYVAMMATYYAKALASQSELETEMRQHLATAAQLRRATEEAERASAAKADFLARMSHELRTPLNAVIGYSQIMIEDADEEGDAEMASDLSKIHAAGQQLLKLVNEVLDLSKIEAGRMEMAPSRVDVARLVARAADQHRARAQAAGLDYRVEIDGDPGVASWDEAKVLHALGQLIDNAIKFTREGHVRIAARALDEDGVPMLRISVEDTGAGIAAKALPHLFEQFAAEEDDSATKYGGRGLGLALARKLCLLMGGDVTVVSRLGEGAVFTITLPRGDTRPADFAESDKLADMEIARLRALIADRAPPGPSERIA